METGKPETIPTFPTLDSLSLLDPKAVLFHRNKDGTLIDRLRERSPVIVHSSPATRLVNEDELKKRIRELEAQVLQNQKLQAVATSALVTENTVSMKPVIPHEKDEMKERVVNALTATRIEQQKSEELRRRVSEEKENVREQKKRVTSEKLKAAWVRRKAAKQGVVI